MADVAPPGPKTGVRPSDTTFTADRSRHFAVDRNELDDVVTLLSDLVASEFYQREGGTVTAWLEGDSGPQRRSISLNQPPKDPSDGYLYLPDIAFILDEVVEWFNDPSQPFAGYSQLLKPLGDAELSRTAPASHYGETTSGTPGELSYRLLFDHKADVYRIASKLLVVAHALQQHQQQRAVGATDHLGYLVNQIAATKSDQLSDVWPTVSLLANELLNLPADQLFLQSQLSQQPLSALEAKRVLNAFSHQYDAAPVTVFFNLPDNAAALADLRLAVKFPEDQLTLQEFIAFFAAAFSQVIPAPVAAAAVAKKDSGGGGGGRSADPADTGAESNQPTTEQPAPATAPPDASLDTFKRQLQDSAGWIQGLAIGQLFTAQGIDPNKVPPQLKQQILTETMAVLVGLSPAELRSPIVRHQVFDRLMDRLQNQNVTFPLAYEAVCRELLQNPQQAKEMADKLAERAKTAQGNDTQRQELQKELDKRLEPLAPLQELLPAVFDAEMAALVDFNQQGLGPNTEGNRKIREKIDELIGLGKENPNFLAHLNTKQLNQLFDLNLNDQQAAQLKEKLPVYMWLRMGQLEQTLGLADISRNLNVLDDTPNGGLSPEDWHKHVETRLRQFEQADNPNHLLGQVPAEDLVIAVAAPADKHTEIIMRYHLGFTGTQAQVATQLIQAGQTPDFTPDQAQAYQYHARVRQVALTNFFQQLNSVDRQVVTQYAQLPPDRPITHYVNQFQPSIQGGFSALQYFHANQNAQADARAFGRKGRNPISSFAQLLGIKGRGVGQITNGLGKIGIQGGTYLADLVLPGTGVAIRTFFKGLRVAGLGGVADGMEKFVGFGLLGGLIAYMLAQAYALYLAATNALARLGYLIGGVFGGPTGGMLGAFAGKAFYEGLPGPAQKAMDFIDGIGKKASNAAKDAWGWVTGSGGKEDVGGGLPTGLSATPDNLVSGNTGFSGNLGRLPSLLSTQTGQIVGAGIATTATVGIITVTTLQGIFQTPLPTIDQAGDLSPFVTIQKQAYDADNNAINTLANTSAPVSVRYEVIVTPKDGYEITISDAKDVLSYTFADAKVKRDGRTLGKDTFGLNTDTPTKTLSLNDEDTTNDTWVISYDETFQPLSDASIRNSMTITFSATKEGESPVASAEATSGFKICVGKCPAAEGEGCWPVVGKIQQEPYGAFSHEIVDAVDISQRTGEPIKAPFGGYACAYPSNTGVQVQCYGRTTNVYGNHVMVGGDDFALIYGHMSQFGPGLTSGGCINVEPGTIIGFIGSTGCSSGPHLHYEVRIRVRAGNEYRSYTSAIPGQPPAARVPDTTFLERLVPGLTIKYPYRIIDRCQPAVP